MKQRIFTPLFCEDLESNINDNLDKYNNSDYSWEEEAKSQDAIRELGFEQPDLSGMMEYADNSLAENDFYAGKILFESYEHLTPLHAAQSHFWQYLSHVVLYKYMCTRWKKNDGTQLTYNNIKEHWFYGQGKIRNWLEGLYWSFKCSAIKKEDGSYDYTYTQFLFCIQKLRDRGIGAATYVMSNPAAIRGILRFYMDELEKSESNPEASVFDKYFEYRTDKCIQLINKLGGVIDIGAYSEEDFYKFLNEIVNTSKVSAIERKRRRNVTKQWLLPVSLPRKRKSIRRIRSIREDNIWQK